MGRNLESRIIKLETRTRHDDEMLLIWRRPKESAQSAVDKARHLFGPNDRVVMAQWYDDNEPPAPAWQRNFPWNVSEQERKALHRFLDGLKSRSAADAFQHAYYLREWCDADLWYEMLKIERAISSDDRTSAHIRQAPKL
jgi:hypothetical protein